MRASERATIERADREQGEAQGDDGVGCSCGWPLDPCNPTYLQTASLCDKERYEREVIPAPADREQGEARGRWTIRICERCGKRAEDHYLGVEPDGCLCALEDFDPADKNQGIREIQVVPAPADREGEQDG